MYRRNSNPSLRNSDREDERDRDTLFSSMSNEVRHPLPPLPGSEDGHGNNNGQSQGSGSNSNSNNTGNNTTGLGGGTPLPLPPSLSRAAPQMTQTQEGQRVSIVGLPPSTTASSSTPPPPPPPALMRSRTVGSRPLSDLTRVAPRVPRSDASSLEKSPLDDQPMSPSGRELDLGLRQVSPVQVSVAMVEGNDDGGSREREQRGRPGVPHRATGQSELDWIVPQARQVTIAPPSPPGPKSVAERMEPTIEHARQEEAKSSKKAQATGWALNIAIGLQVLISALITGLSAVTSGKNTQVMTSVLGGAGTVVASYLARARGSNEPELSISRVKDLQRFIRECEAFVQDHGYDTGHEYDERIERLREDFEHLLGNGNGERKLSNTPNV